MRKLAILFLGLALLAAACNKSQPAANPNPPSSQDNNQNQAAPAAPKTYEINMAAGFNPATLTIKKGDLVKFVNTDSKPHWPASAPHPTHTDYPEFDSKRAIAPGETWSFTFGKVGSWKFHDHLNSSSFGKITVTE
ncbi:MAG: hypothetical protein A3J07_03705 [Candidatus Doudnabacteria bacterium RIFCSPLOWO2_02_FULL_49_13]|uniref:EfeO-type cupredoxin-like domain-containing protein n=1 Tax=Candidatus Doudnabacteria bacterium RIFCSPHIGHO2_12_FULL_48_16 TaxID=1817838 RepID=A0A1F5PJP8_9BACT|nr:MAG: hypothetical protein A3B77_02515 [Candidatus Doudnabacteria bacterium RIFCSPHIGHO2_02_FULL_49_24]OGE89581.1 MAG: hypothetical protein A2760_03720 [Candidatus Doudnabacteria bacterium RIFCSPHIGHO2_01_FULL_50_67]OGE90024.1 MAG: hypothetical protein A3E29_02850 [Candidatus Doudnabacteria bacterium RIFCSPHIGHO2_12_FULL_48_16]OGE96597.1 MAG: hypothetical protein A2990_00160 [Candidatus Doudnabacteria bacterium RIFCSPLOWO2_01_FULL_49_40]OGF02915.1 MAG: hypothetical protein A3H14_00365 [Candid